MLLRRISPLALSLVALAACEPSVDQRGLPAPVDAAVFDPTTGRIPLPNTLALASIPAAAVAAGCPATLGTAQNQFLCQFAKAGGFPNDQEVAITVDFTRSTFSTSTSAVTGVPVAIDLATVKAFTAGANPTVAIFRVDAGGPGPVQPDATFGPADVAAATGGKLVLHNKVDATGSRRWPAGAQYVVAVRGGPNGVKTADGKPIAAASTMFVLLQSAIADKSLLELENQGALPGTAAQKAAAAAQLEPIRVGYRQALLGTVIAANPWPVGETISLQTFTIAPAPATNPTVVEVDSSKGSLPLPSTLLYDVAGGHISAQAACSLVQGTFNPVTQTCSNPASAGFQALDGFSTTAMALAPTSLAVDAATVTAANVFLYKITTAGEGTKTATRLTDLAGALGAGTPAAAKYVTQPPAIQAACPVVNGTSGKCSPVIGLQPAVPATVPGVGNFFLPPLDGASTYAVVITNRVKDAAGRPLGKSTVAKLLLDVSLPLTAGGASIVGGVDTATALALEDMKANVAPALASLPAGTTAADVVMAYSFKTQTITTVSQGLSAAPYSVEAAAGTGGAAVFTTGTPAVFDPQAKLGIPLAAFPDVNELLEVGFLTLNVVNPATGALQADQSAWSALPLTALVATPKAANVTADCPGTGGTVKCAPLVIFHHGINGGRWQVLPAVNALTKAGFVVVAADMRLHGDRARCDSDADCASGAAGSCVPVAAEATQGDAVVPGTCTGGLAFDPVRATTNASGNYFISGNFFRIRDTIRADMFDNAALVLAFARPPAPYPQPAAGAGTAFRDRLLAGGVAVDPTKVYYFSQSLGSIIGSQILSTNPRYSRAVLAVPGGSLVDIFTNAPAFRTDVAGLFTSLLAPLLTATGHVDGAGAPVFSFDLVDSTKPACPVPAAGDNACFDLTVASSYLKLLQVAKLTLDPADPLNYAATIQTKLPSPLFPTFGGTPLYSATTQAFGLIANQDLVVPNPFNFEFFNLTGAPPIPTTFYVSASAANNAVDHSFLFLTGSATPEVAAGAVQGQADVVNFLLDGNTVPPAQVTLP